MIKRDCSGTAGAAVAALLAAALCGCGVPEGDSGGPDTWPRFRGPGGAGVASGDRWPTSWDVRTGKHIAWVLPLPGEGKGSPIVWHDAIYLTSADPGNRTLTVLRVNRREGTVVWRRDMVPAFDAWTPAERKAFLQQELAQTGWAAPTPVTDGRRVWAAFGTGDVVCCSSDGALVWQRNLGPPVSKYGLAASLVRHKDRIIWQLDQGDSPQAGLSVLIALDGTTGETVWRTPRAVENGWATPVIAQVDGHHELITTATDYVIAYDPATGEEFWRAEGTAGEIGPSPVVHDGIVYVVNEGTHVIAIRAGGRGDVTNSHILWRSDRTAAHTASPVCNGRFLLEAGYVLICHDAESGEVVWEHDPGAWASASPTLAGGMVYLPTRDGITHIFGLGPEYEAHGEADVKEAIEATPAFAGGRIYIRGRRHLFCISR